MDPPSPNSETSQSDAGRQVKAQIDKYQKETHSSDADDKNEGEKKTEVEAGCDQTHSSHVLEDESSHTRRFHQRGHTYAVVRVGGGKPIVIEYDPSEEQHSEPASDPVLEPHRIKSEGEEGHSSPGGLESDDDSGTFRSTFTNESFGFSTGARGGGKSPR